MPHRRLRQSSTSSTRQRRVFNVRRRPDGSWTRSSVGWRSLTPTWLRQSLPDTSLPVHLNTTSTVPRCTVDSMEAAMADEVDKARVRLFLREVGTLCKGDKCQHSRVYGRVLDSRRSYGDTVTRRRKICKACNERFTTYEIRASDLLNFVTAGENSRAEEKVRLIELVLNGR